MLNVHRCGIERRHSPATARNFLEVERRTDHGLERAQGIDAIFLSSLRLYPRLGSASSRPETSGFLSLVGKRASGVRRDTTHAAGQTTLTLGPFRAYG